MARASEPRMEELHGALCDYFLKLIGGQIPELVKETSIERDQETGAELVSSKWVETGLFVRPGAGDLAVMAKFLKDNAITGPATEGSTLSELEKQLAARHKRTGKVPTTADVVAAMRDMGSELVQ
jgi:hypothetical protein